MKVELLNSGPKVWISPIARAKMDAYVDLHNEEISWLGLVHRFAPMHFFIQDVYLVKQACNGGTTEMDKSAQSDLFFKLLQDKVISVETQDDLGIYLWGHSHHNMGVGASTQDDKQLTDFLEIGDQPFFFRQIQNKRGDLNLQLYLPDAGVKFTELSMQVFYPEMKELKEVIAAEIKEKVSRLTYTAVVTGTAGKPLYGAAKDAWERARSGSNEGSPKERSTRGDMEGFVFGDDDIPNFRRHEFDSDPTFGGCVIDADSDTGILSSMKDVGEMTRERKSAPEKEEEAIKSPQNKITITHV